MICSNPNGIIHVVLILKKWEPVKEVVKNIFKEIDSLGENCDHLRLKNSLDSVILMFLRQCNVHETFAHLHHLMVRRTCNHND